VRAASHTRPATLRLLDPLANGDPRATAA